MAQLDIGSALYSQESHGPVELLPNPHFVFPARSDPTLPQSNTWSSISRRPRSEQNLSGNASAAMPRARASVSALPTFSFNPAGGLQTPPATTPPLSPSFTGPSTPSRASRHRRGGSEFIGGDSKIGSISVVNTSPGAMEFPQSDRPLHLGPPPGRRHAHRRSGAISCHDLASVLQPKDTNAQIRADSAPTSPLDAERKAFGFPNGQRRSSETSLNGTSIKEATEDEEGTQSRPPSSRARVGFADRVEYIRPLSTISSETESSMSTIRGHSVSGSLSSMISLGTASPQSVRRIRPALNTTFEDDVQPRPHTSSDFSNSPIARRDPFGPSLLERPRSEAGLPSPTVNDSQVKRKSFSWWESKSSKRVATTSIAQEHTFNPEPVLLAAPDSPVSRSSVDSDQETVRGSNASQSATSSNKKPRKVKNWAHSIISRKNKNGKKSKRPATPPAPKDIEDADMSDSNSSQAELESESFEPNFDDDNTVTIVNEAAKPQLTPRMDAPIMSQYPPSDLDVLSPVIDLDAALGPFSSFGPPGQGKNAPRSRRSMHSGVAGPVNFSTPHRRTESAPELAPFDIRTAKFSSPSVMPDVFEEEDEELAESEEEEQQGSSEILVNTDATEAAQSPGSESHVVEADESTNSPNPWPLITGYGSTRRKKSRGLSIDTGSRPSSMVLDSSDKFQVSSTSRSSHTIDVVEDYEDVRESTSDDTITPPRTGQKDAEDQDAMQFSVPMVPQHIMTPDTMSDSSMNSPVFSPSQASLDASRAGTVASSVTDGSLLVFGEPGPEVRISVDDVPSLTSSRSTMTSPIVHPSLPPFANRAASVYSTHSSGTAELSQHKRGSIASLSKLVTGSFERSKLSIETRPVSQHVMIETKKTKTSRHRLSKLMQFWKTKEEKGSKRIEA